MAEPVHFEIYTVAWCRPCQDLKAVQGQLEQPVTWVDVTDDIDMAVKRSIRRYPTTIARRGDVEIARIITAKPSFINAFFRDHATLLLSEDF